MKTLGPHRPYHIMKKIASHKYTSALFTAEMVQDKQTIRRLAVLQYDLFQTGRKLLFILVGIFMIFFGVMADLSLQAAGIVVFLGCFCLWFRKAPAQITANRMVDAIGGAYPHTKLYFHQDGADITDGKEWFHMPYHLIQRLVQDKKYYYLWLTHSTCYMIDKTTVEPDSNRFQNFLEEQTGLLTEKPPTLFQFNIAAVIRRMKNAKAKKKQTEQVAESETVSRLPDSQNKST